MSTRPRPEHLLAAYVESTGIRVGLSRQRRDWLAQICAMPHGFTAEDVLRVLAGIKEHIKRGSSGYSGRSLMFSNAMNPERFEERALLCREAKERSAAMANRKAQMAKAKAEEPEPLPPDPKVSAGFVELKKLLRGGSGI